MFRLLKIQYLNSAGAGSLEFSVPCWLRELKLVCFFFYLNLFIFNWKIIALQHCDGLCDTSTWITHRYTHVPSRLKPPSPFPSHPTPLGCHRAPGVNSLRHTANSLWLSNCIYGRELRLLLQGDDLNASISVYGLHLASILYSSVFPNFRIHKSYAPGWTFKAICISHCKGLFSKISAWSLKRLMHVYWAMGAWVRAGLSSRSWRVCSHR